MRQGGAVLLYLLGAACGGVLIASAILRGHVSDAVIGVVLLAIVFASSSWGMRQVVRRFPQHTPPDEIAAAPVVIYWRPGCMYCQNLRMRLGRMGKQALWVNIWRDSVAAERVRKINEGNETVPTVIISGQPHTNPDPDLVRRALVDA